MKKKLYNSPSMEIHALKVERGFAQSGIDPFDYSDDRTQKLDLGINFDEFGD